MYLKNNNTINGFFFPVRLIIILPNNDIIKSVMTFFPRRKISYSPAALKEICKGFLLPCRSVTTKNSPVISILIQKNL